MKILTKKLAPAAPGADKELLESGRPLTAQVAVSQELRELLAEMKRVEGLFNLTLDDCLIESCIYRYNALSAQVSHILREAKGAGGQ